ncbi:hypothetical protein EHO61_01405 [Leptospira fluminis]|uniref:Uncharacterized protein n=1 Tax=Leptospira fluminis TaxID=2484979 RepID=A0A4R9GTH6_9LEPT|nr:hypothetical protein EHO61_01405 [Leptospira fluminis]
MKFLLFLLLGYLLFRTLRNFFFHEKHPRFTVVFKDFSQTSSGGEKDISDRAKILNSNDSEKR